MNIDPSSDLGTILVVVAAVLAASVSFGLRTRFPAPAVVAVLALAGAALAWGGVMLLGGTTLEYALAVPVMAALVPIHVRIVLGRFGKR